MALEKARTGETAGTSSSTSGLSTKSSKWLAYKGRLKGIRVVDLNESYTSQTCCQCNTMNKSSRVHQGLYVCKHCGAEMHADVNGAVNFLIRYLPEQIGFLGVVAVCHSLQSTVLSGEIPGHLHQPMNRGSGKQLAASANRICSCSRKL
jgi:putative transposase-like DNA-binding protein